jgi:replication factor A2
VLLKPLFFFLFIVAGMDFQGGEAGGGGGFSSNDNNFGGSQGSPDKRSRRNYDEQTLIPVTIAMAFKARPDSSGGNDVLLLEDGRTLHSVKIIGAVRSADVQSTNIMYTIEDGTGALNVKQWADDNDVEAIGEMKRQNAKEGIYVKVIGQISDYDGKKQLVANSVQPLSSGDELTHHLLEVMYCAEKFKQADSIVAAPIMQNNNGMAFGSSNSMQAKMEGGDDKNSIKERVLQFLRENDSETGASIDVCIQQLNDIAEADIRQAADHLSEEGQIYSTINESFFKVAM